RILILAAAGSLLATGAMAQTVADLDSDQDGQLSLAEVQAAAPDVSAEVFASYDTDQNGYLSEEEFEVWKEASKDAMKDDSEGGNY
ncbi:MAG: hypothetical protein AAGA69_05500, partial [Pseudomonadota bacterium]